MVLHAALKRLAAAGATVVLAGCISLPQTEALRQSGTGTLPPRAELTGVPFVEQDDYLCGPATLAMVLNDAGVQATLQSLTEQVYLPGRQGSLQVEMLAATRRNGLIAYPLGPRLENVLREVAGGTPVIVLQNLTGLGWVPLWHYSVVIGFDLQAEKVILRSGRYRRQEGSIGMLEYTWQDGGHWAMVAVPPGRIPATATEAEFAAAIAAFERTGRTREARDAYSAAVTRWPTSLVGLIGLGNTEYALGDRTAAAAAFSRATVAHPESGAAFNNLAHTLSEIGRLGEAEQAARKAVSLGGATKPTAEKTLDEILRKRARP